MDRYTLLYFIGIFFSLATYLWLLISGIEDSITYKANLQLTILAAISFVGSFVKLPKCFISNSGTLREQCLFFGLHTLQAVGLIFNIFAFRKDYTNISYILIGLISVIYIVNFIIFFPKFMFFRKKK